MDVRSRTTREPIAVDTKQHEMLDCGAKGNLPNRVVGFSHFCDTNRKPFKGPILH